MHYFNGKCMLWSINSQLAIRPEEISSIPSKGCAFNYADCARGYVDISKLLFNINYSFNECQNAGVCLNCFFTVFSKNMLLFHPHHLPTRIASRHLIYLVLILIPTLNFVS